MTVIPPEERCVKQCMTRERWPRPFRCARRVVVGRDGKLYCKGHDPEVKKAKEAAERAKLNQQHLARQQRSRRAKALGLSLGVATGMHYSLIHKDYTDHVVISFDDAEKLVERLKEKS